MQIMKGTFTGIYKEKHKDILMLSIEEGAINTL